MSVLTILSMLLGSVLVRLAIERSQYFQKHASNQSGMPLGL